MLTLTDSAAVVTTFPFASTHAHAFISSEAEDMSDDELEDPAVLATHRSLFPLPAPAGGWFDAETHAVTAAAKRTTPDYWERAREYHAGIADEALNNQQSAKRAACLSFIGTNIRGREVTEGGKRVEGGRAVTKEGRRQKVRVTAGVRAASSAFRPRLLTSPLLAPSNVGTDKRFRSAILPEGILAVLPVYSTDILGRLCTAAALDIVHRLGRGRRASFTPLNAEQNRRKYGRTTINGKKSKWAWDVVSLDLRRAGVIEVEVNPTTRRPTYAATGTMQGVAARSMRYRLTETWRDRLTVLVPRSIDLAVPETPHVPATRADGTQLEVHPWLESCLERAGYDLEGAVRAVLAFAGAPEPASLGFDDVKAAIASGTPSEEVLADVELWRDSKDTRPALAIARAQAQGQVDHLYAWQVEGDSWCFRDSAGHRLHSPVTNLAEHLRRFLSLDGEELVTIDAVNSQLVFVAEGARLNHASPDALDCVKVCGEGRFYEVAFEVCYGRKPTAMERNLFKRVVMRRWLFAHGADQVSSPEGIALGKHWPQTSGWMLAEKVTGNRELPCSCQRREATVWIDTIVPRLAAAKISCLTVHDSVMVPASRADEARAIVEAVYAEQGLLARFKSH